MRGSDTLALIEDIVNSYNIPQYNSIDSDNQSGMVVTNIAEVKKGVFHHIVLLRTISIYKR